jgi:four helix bundle protein
VIDGFGDLGIEERCQCTPEALRERTKEFALRVVKMFRALPKSAEGGILGRQVLRSGTSIGANYRAACRARSRAEFVSRVAIAVEEADETIFWLELLGDARILPASRLQGLLRESNELLAILSASRRTAKLSITKSPNR